MLRPNWFYQKITVWFWTLQCHIVHVWAIPNKLFAYLLNRSINDMIQTWSVNMYIYYLFPIKSRIVLLFLHVMCNVIVNSDIFKWNWERYTDLFCFIKKIHHAHSRHSKVAAQTRFYYTIGSDYIINNDRKAVSSITLIKVLMQRNNWSQKVTFALV